MADLKKIAELNVEKCMSEVFANQNNVREYLRVVGQFPLFDYRNQLLIWKQCKDAKVVAGKAGMEASGYTIPADAKKILLLMPTITLAKEGTPILTENGGIRIDEDIKAVVYEVLPEYVSDYQAIVGYDISDQVESTTRSTDSLVNKIKEISQYSIIEMEETFEEKTKHGEIDIENDTFRICRDLTENVFYAELLSQFVEQQRKDQPSDDYELCFRALAKYAICSAFGVASKEQSLIRFNTAKRESVEFRRRLLEELSFFTSTLILQLSTGYLTFNEVMLANLLLHDADFSTVQIDFYTVRDNLQDEYLKDQILQFTEKLFMSKDGYLEELCEKVKNRELYTYPSYPFELAE